MKIDDGFVFIYNRVHALSGYGKFDLILPITLANVVQYVKKRDVAKDSHFIGKIPEGKYLDFATPCRYGGW